jgi:hypothetical protein
MADHTVFGTNARYGSNSWVNSRKTRCVRGHELSDPNLDAGSLSRGHRRCRACLYGQAWAQRNGLPMSSPEAIEYTASRYAEIMNQTGE